MRKARFCITYTVSTDDSASAGDCSDHGYWMPGGWEHSLPEDREGVILAARNGEFDLPLSQALRAADSLGIGSEFQATYNGFSCVTADEAIDYETGEHRSYTLHGENISPGSIARIKRLFLRS